MSLFRNWFGKGPKECAQNVGALRSAGDVEGLCRILRDAPKPGQRKEAATALKELDDATAVPSLIEATCDEDWEVRLAAVAGLDAIGDNRALDALYERLTGGPEEYAVSLASVIALGNLRDRRAVHALVQVLDSTDGNARSAAAEALGKIGDRKAVEPLVRCLGDQDPFVRQLAVGALEKIQDPDVIPSLQPLLNDGDERVREWAQRAVEKLVSIQVPDPSSPFLESEGSDEAEEGSGPVFIGRDTKGKNTYETYRAESAEEARFFLRDQEVDKPFHYVQVETPDGGTWGLDKEGLYLIRLLDWQTDLDLAVCEGTVAGKPNLFALQNVLEGISDNLVARIACGMCGQEWDDGIRYPEATVVLCPACKAHNTVDAGKQIQLG